MLILPLLPDLRVGHKPIVTLGLILVCFLIHLLRLPIGFDGWLYYPESFNPITMLAASLAHADWPHLIFNMIFYAAFAVALELLIGGVPSRSQS